MAQLLKVQTTRFINAEPALLPFDGPIPTPVVILSFGDEENPIQDHAIGVQDARDMVMDLLESLATIGDPLAQEIGRRYFGKAKGSCSDDGCDCG